MKKAVLFFMILVFAVSCAAGGKKRTFGQALDDEFIALSLRTKFIKDKTVPSNEILINVWQGVVMLKGEMENQDEINRAIELAERQKGVKEVKAFLVLKSFGRLKEDKTKAKKKKSFFKEIFGTKEKSRSAKSDVLQEKNLQDPQRKQVQVSSQPQEQSLFEEDSMDNLDQEQEF